MLDFLQVAQGEDKALRVSLTLPDQEEATGKQSSITEDPWLPPCPRVHDPRVSDPWICRPTQPCPLPIHQALLPNEPLALLTGNASMEPGLGAVDGWSGGKQMGCHSRKGIPIPPGMLREAEAAPRSLGALGHHPPALRLVPEHGVGRLRRWFVFFCSRGDMGSQGVVGSVNWHPPSGGSPRVPLSFLPTPGKPLWRRVPSQTCRCMQAPHPPGLGLLQGCTQSFPGVLDDSPSMAGEVHGHQGVIRDTPLEMEQDGEGTGQNNCPGPGPGGPPPASAPGYTHQGWGTQIGWTQVTRLGLLIILVQLHPILRAGKERGGVKRAENWL